MSRGGGFLSKIGDAFGRPTSATGLALFRVLISAIMLMESFQWLHFFEVIEAGRSDAEQTFRYYFLFVQMAALTALMVGYFTRVAAVINFATCMTFFGTTHLWEYHVDFTYSAVSLFFLFAPISRVWSLDAWRDAKHTAPFKRASIPRGWYWAGAFVIIGLPYLDSVVFKLGDPMWQAGLGVWRPSIIPSDTFGPVDLTNALLNQYALMVSLSWTTVALEVVFLFAIWFAKMRLLLVLVGVSFHIGIAAAFPIPFFAAAQISLYVLLVPASAWDRLLGWAGLAETTAEIAPVRAADRFARKLPIVLVVFSVVQCLSIGFVSPLGLSFTRSVLPDSVVEFARPKVRAVLRKTRLVGSRTHPLFLTSHFIRHDHEIAFVEVQHGKRVFVPLLSEQGQVREYNTGRQWAFWTFRVIADDTRSQDVERGVRLYSRFWLKENDRWPVEDATFEILARKIDVRLAWERDRLKRNAAQPWVKVGQASWSGEEFTYDLSDVDATVAAAP